MKREFQLISIAVAALLGLAVGEMLYIKYKTSKIHKEHKEHKEHQEHQEHQEQKGIN